MIMQREIKFRAWTGNNMEYSVGASKDGGFYCHKNKQDTASFHTTLYPKHVPIMQFTGLKDKNGKDIYERDIIINNKVPNTKYTVEWIKSSYQLTRPDDREFFGNGKIYGAFISVIKSIEVIGNIYENKELLK